MLKCLEEAFIRYLARKGIEAERVIDVTDVQEEGDEWPTVTLWYYPTKPTEKRFWGRDGQKSEVPKGYIYTGFSLSNLLTELE